MRGHFRILQRTISACVLMLLAIQASAQSSWAEMELHLVLAFDVSASVNDDEFHLQRRGTAQAIRSELVSRAIADAPGGVAVAIIQWSSVTRQALGLDWVELHSIEDAKNYADDIDAMPRRIPGGGTMIHSGLSYASRLLEAAPRTARRQVIDIAGNGRGDDPDRLQAMRDKLLKEGIVINGLAIEELKNDLTSYFYRNVIGGTGAFVVTASGFEDFSEAMQIKLHREIEGASYATLTE
ncbi:von Willebrand factor type A domain protein [Roseovarius albus]|uniref:von Willebrand factor type A domain protein n=1 Tax=Roseovarius albus TaxID=1247867 RepID=A0A1X6Y4M4_9RHOB|nr:DUF1194 domain-containing protein [Roseovarius albus]SLN10546.1 von Willebrand factor type A domain protein [Roseovarius albus]